MKLGGAALILTLSFSVGCGEDKDYGDPIEDEFVKQSATAAVTSASGVNNLEADAPVASLNTLSAYLTALVNAKYQHLYGGDQTTQRIDTGTRNLVDEACMSQTAGEITYNACETLGLSVDGTVSVSDNTVEVNLNLAAVQDVDPEYSVSTEISILGKLKVTASEIDGFLDFSTFTETDDLSARVDLDSDFNVVLDSDGCATDGKIEVHAFVVSKTARAKATQDLWVKANFGPECGDVTVR